jgi:pimeloyl-ACP methyl ester carboxylesterase
MPSPESNLAQPNLDIFYTCLSPSPHSDNKDPSHAPIVFLHGHESCHLEYSRTTPFLSEDYEIFLIDLPGHSRSRDILPFTLDNAVNALSHLVSTKVEGGRAHIVGLSLGGFVGLELARRHPELVLSLFCTGCAPLNGYKRWFMTRPHLLGGLTIGLNLFATDAMFWLSIGLEPVPGLREEFRRNQNMTLLRAGYDAATSVSFEDLAKIQGVRVAIVAGSKHDSVEETRKAGRVIGTKNAECKAFVVRDAVHLWDLQLPELFAQGVRAWVEGNDMPKEFEVLK